MRFFIFPIITFIFLTGCFSDEDHIPIFPHWQDNIPTGRADKMPGAHVSNAEFQYRIRKIEWISSLETDTTVTEYFYHDDLLSSVVKSNINDTSIYIYSNDTVYLGRQFLTFQDGKLMTKCLRSNPEWSDTFSWDGNMLSGIHYGNEDFFLKYDVNGILSGLSGSNFCMSFEYKNNSLEKVISTYYFTKRNNYNHKRKETLEYVYSYNETGLISQIISFNLTGTTYIYTFQYDNIGRLISLVMDTGKRTGKYHYYYELGRGNALYLYHPRDLFLWPFDYYIGSILCNIPSVQ